MVIKAKMTLYHERMSRGVTAFGVFLEETKISHNAAWMAL